MKKLIATIIGIIVAIGAMMAQSSQLATLSHKGTIQTFYGANALMDAHAVAVNGDVITLSSGSFNGGTITKAITIRGAGVGMDTVSNTMPTIINSAFTIFAPTNDSSNLVLEGLSFNSSMRYQSITHPMFLKCKFKDIYYSSSYSVMTDATFMHCLITGQAALGTSEYSSTGTIINSVFKDIQFIKNFTITNSIIFSLRTGSSCQNCNFYNCIIETSGGSSEATGGGNISYLNVAYNCIGYNFYSKNIFANIPDNSSNSSCKLETIFVSGAGGYTQNESILFQLSEKGKTYIGNDGKEVGIYGGNMPFDLRTTTPQITKCNVAAKSTVDGKLSVDIEVSEIE